MLKKSLVDYDHKNLLNLNRNEKKIQINEPKKYFNEFFKNLKSDITIIGVGGIDSGRSVYEKIINGAKLVQLYTGMVYKGPGIIKDIKKELISKELY